MTSEEQNQPEEPAPKGEINTAFENDTFCEPQRNTEERHVTRL